MYTKREGLSPKKKMTKEEMQLAIIKKKECDAKALKIVEQLLEPTVDHDYLINNLKYLSKCHMEDVIEERAITKMCGYVLCNKPIAVDYKQKYHISLKDKKVYDVTKRKNFCSSSCFGASNYLLEQMLISPLWMRDKEKIPKFTILPIGSSQNSSNSPANKNGVEVNIKTREFIKSNDESEIQDSDKVKKDEENTENGIEGSIETFVLEIVKNFELKTDSLAESSEKLNATNNNLKLKEKTETKSACITSELDKTDNIKNESNEKKEIGNRVSESTTGDVTTVNNIKNKNSTVNSKILDSKKKCQLISMKSVESIALNLNLDKNNTIEQNILLTDEHNIEIKTDNNVNADNMDDIIQQRVHSIDDDIIQQCIYPARIKEIDVEDVEIQQNIHPMADNCETDDEDDIIEQHVYLIEKNEMSSGKTNESKIFSKQREFTKSVSNSFNNEYNDNIEQGKAPIKLAQCGIQDVIESEKIEEKKVSATTCDPIKIKNKDENNSEITKGIKFENKKKKISNKDPLDGNLAAKVEQSFQQWITKGTINYLFGDASVKQEAIDKIETQDKYTLLCQKLNRLQFEDEREDEEILKNEPLNPAPHFAVLKEEGEKLNLKVRAFYQGKLTFEQPEKSNNEEEINMETFIPLTEGHAPQILRRKIFLDKLDQVLPDLLRTLAGNNEVFARASLNYTSVRCVAVKALIQTFALSAKNIIFKTPEWTLVGLVIIKMLSLSDACLASLLSTQQANLYISMILTAYKLNSDYLNLLVASFNPNINPR